MDEQERQAQMAHDELCHVPRTVPHLEAYARWLRKVIEWAAVELHKLERAPGSPAGIGRLQRALADALHKPMAQLRPHQPPDHQR